MYSLTGNRNFARKEELINYLQLREFCTISPTIVWYVHTNMLNLCQIASFMAAVEGPVAEFSSFANFEEKKRKSKLLMSFPKIGNQMGCFG